ncbi:unnamed protein product [Urochloa humidicola]
MKLEELDPDQELVDPTLSPSFRTTPSLTELRRSPKPDSSEPRPSIPYNREIWGLSASGSSSPASALSSYSRAFSEVLHGMRAFLGPKICKVRVFFQLH